MLHLTAPEEHILSALAASRVTTSAVTLAADLWKAEDSTMGADPVGYVQWVLDSLCQRGLVIFRVKETTMSKAEMVDELQGQSPYEHFAYQIRLTPEGWSAVGYPTIHGEVGGPSRHFGAPMHPGDRTDYRTHKATGEAYPIERSRLLEHLEQERTHYHGTVDDPHEYLGQWRCPTCRGPMLRSGSCLFGCRRPDSELVQDGLDG